MRKPRLNELLLEIINEAAAALTTKNFEDHIKRIHRNVYILEGRMKRFEDMRFATQIDKIFEKTKDEV